MFTAKRLSCGSALYRSRRTGTRYIVSSDGVRFILYREGEIIARKRTRAELIDQLERVAA